jgi:hypothetical protein
MEPGVGRTSSGSGRSAEAKITTFVDELEALVTLRANESVDLTANVTETVE